MRRDAPAPRTWSELTDAQWSVMWDALYEDDLVLALNGWTGNTDDAPYWNRKEKYVAELSNAALFLLRAGLVEVWERPVDFGDAGLLPTETAERVLATQSNWWSYDPDAHWDPEEDMSRHQAYEHAATGDPATHTYSLAATDKGRDLVRDGGERRKLPDRRSPEVRQRDAERERLNAKWRAICEAVSAGQRTGLRCPVNEDADLQVSWQPHPSNPADPANSSAYRHAGATVMTCPTCGATREIRHMARQ